MLTMMLCKLQQITRLGFNLECKYNGGIGGLK
jgi:hypothetical protein